jgi:hypothetical protein
MTESLKRIAGLVEIGTVAIKTSTDMGKMHLTVEDSGVGVLKLVKMKHIGMYEINTFILSSLASRPFLDRTSFLSLGTSHG